MRLIFIVIVIKVLFFGCEKQKSNNNDLNKINSNSNSNRSGLDIDKQIEIITKANSKILQENDSISLSLIEFSLNVKEVEKMFRIAKQNRIKIFFFSKYKITPETKTRFSLFGVGFKIIKSFNVSNRYQVIELVSFNQEGKDIFLKYKYGGVFIVVYLTRINNNYIIKEYIEYET